MTSWIQAKVAAMMLNEAYPLIKEAPPDSTEARAAQSIVDQAKKLLA